MYVKHVLSILTKETIFDILLFIFIVFYYKQKTIQVMRNNVR